MTIQEAVGRFLPTVDGLSALVDTRIYWLNGPDSTVPAVVFRRASSKRLAVPMTGKSMVGLHTFEVVSLSEDSPDAAQAIADVISAGMDGYTGLMGEVRVRQCSLTDESDMPFDEFGLYAVQQTYELTA